MESKRQLQLAELVKRNISVVLQTEGSFIYGSVFVTVTNVRVTPDLALAKIYLSVYNTNKKEETVDLVNRENKRLRKLLARRIGNKVRRIPEIAFYLDDTLDEMYKLNELFDQIDEKKIK